MPFTTQTPISLDFVNSRDMILARPKFDLILRTQATTNPIINSVDLVQIIVRKGHEKHGKWLSPPVLQEVHNSSGTVTVSSTNGHKIIASIEYTRSAIVYDDLSSLIV